LIDLELDFNITGYEDTTVARDFAFVEKDGKTLAVFPSGTEHKVAIVEIGEGDLSSASNEPRYVTFNSDEFIAGSAPHGRYRRVEWAVNTDYVWVSDGSLQEVYIIDVMKGEVVNTLSEVDPGSLVSVQNFEREHQMSMQQDLINSMIPSSSVEMSDDDNDDLETAAIIIGIVAIVVGVVNFLYMMKMRKDFKEDMKGTDPRKLIQKGEIENEVESENGLESINSIN